MTAAPQSKPPPVDRLGGSVLAAISGLLLGFAYPPFGWWPLALAGVAGLTWLCRRISLGRGAWYGLVFGLSYLIVMLWWLYTVLPGVQFAAAAVESLFYALLGVLLVAASRLPARMPARPLLIALLAGCSWAAVEVFRGSFPLGGMPWGRLGTTVVDTPLAHWARYLGESGPTFVIGFGCALVVALLSSGVGLRRRLVAALALVGVAVAGWLLPVGLVGAGSSSPDTVTVAVIQGDVPGQGIHSFSDPRVVLHNHAQATHELAENVRAGTEPAPDVVIWPENGSDIDPTRDANAYSTVQQAVDDIGVPVLIGAVTEGPGPDHVQGTGIVWLPGEGPTEEYHKHRLVPFGEWVPFRSFSTRLVPLLAEEIPRDFVPGDRPGLLDLGPVRLGAVMCFEIAYDTSVRAVARGGTELLAVQTNNATYLGSGQLEQQWAITRLRAVESGRAVAVAATTGISGFVAPDGSVLARTHDRHRIALVQTLPVASGTTPGIRFGGWVDLAVLIGAGIALAGGVLGGRPRGRSDDDRTVGRVPAPHPGGAPDLQRESQPRTDREPDPVRRTLGPAAGGG